jgi:putative inorganic carbon (HCO3(-)) transporter
MSSSVGIPARRSPSDAAGWTVAALFRPLHALMAVPSLLFLATLGVMLFRPPDLQFYAIDRFAFLLLVVVVLLRAFVLRQSLRVAGPVTLPMLALLLLALSCVLVQPFEPQNWSLFAAKWMVPFTLFHLAGLVFDDAAALRRFEMFSLVVLGYLSLIAVLFLFDAKEMIFPRYILDESLGIHADRARGPFLQAVANGVTLNLLGLIALDSFRRKRLRGLVALLFLIAIPLAVLATKTRAVWLSFAASVLGLLVFCSNRRMRRASLGLALAGGLGLFAMLSVGNESSSLSSRLQELSPVEFRLAVYRAGGEMFLEKPLSGWGAHNLQAELAKRITDFHQEAFFFHNTYLEIGVEHGLLGLALYLWLIVDLIRLGRRRASFIHSPDGSFFDQQFRTLWPFLMAVYLVNASFVVMNYQFVNGLLFTLAGILAAQNRQAETRFLVLSN